MAEKKTCWKVKSSTRLRHWVWTEGAKAGRLAPKHKHQKLSGLEITTQCSGLNLRNRSCVTHWSYKLGGFSVSVIYSFLKHR